MKRVPLWVYLVVLAVAAGTTTGEIIYYLWSTRCT